MPTVQPIMIPLVCGVMVVALVSAKFWANGWMVLVVGGAGSLPPTMVLMTTVVVLPLFVITEVIVCTLAFDVVVCVLDSVTEDSIIVKDGVVVIDEEGKERELLELADDETNNDLEVAVEDVEEDRWLVKVDDEDCEDLPVELDDVPDMDGDDDDLVDVGEAEEDVEEEGELVDEESEDVDIEILEEAVVVVAGVVDAGVLEGGSVEREEDMSDVGVEEEDEELNKDIPTLGGKVDTRVNECLGGEGKVMTGAWSFLPSLGCRCGVTILLQFLK